MSLADRPSQSITEFIARLKQDAGLDLNAAEIANILWLAIAIEKVAPSTTEDVLPIEIEPSGVEVVEVRTESTPASPPASLPQIPLVTELPLVTEPGRRSGALPISVPDSSALPQSLQLGRSLRPLMRKERSRSRLVLDEEATVVQIAEESIWSPVMQPAPERWLELAIVVEATDVLEVWQDTITEFQHLMERQGAFRDVRSWQLIGNEVGDRTRDDWGTAQLFRRGSTGQVDRTQPRKPKELLDPMGRRLILFVSDCTSDGWRSGRVLQLLAQWMEQNPVTILQLLPERFWERSALGLGDSVWLRATLPGMLNDRLGVEGLSRRRARSLQKPLSLPIITLDPQPLLQWAKVMAGFGAQSTAGVVLEMEAIAPSLPTEETVATEAVGLEPLTAEQLVRRFRGTASPIARQLAEMMAAVPVSWSVIRLIQRTLLPEAKTEHVAEIFLSGLLCPATIHEGSKGLRRGYEFVGGVRDSLIRAVPIAETEWVMEEVADDVLEQLPLDVQRQLSEAIARQFGASARSFSAFLLTDLLNDLPIDPSVRAEFVPFATVTSQVLQRLGREYAVLAQAIDTAPLSTLTEFPPVQTLEFITVQLSDSGDNDNDTAPSPFQLQTEQFTVATLSLEPELHSLEPFEFTVSTLNRGQAGILRRTKWVIQQRQQQAWRLIEPLEDDLILEMVSIPGGQFLMGSPMNEIDRYEYESPQHDVEVGGFLMGRYPVAQAQWRFVAELPQSDRPLEFDPSYFKGDNRPVERVSWHDATEFCARLSQYTGRLYRLPTESEWEYACRAGTITPFHFGETITTELANYRGTDNKDYKWSGSYGEGPKGEYREETTPVDQFRIANAFGLCDMHGNVWEWCQDHWHENYEGAPVDGISWVNPEAEEDTARVLRGGSWGSDPRNCRSASRNFIDAGVRNLNLGFRVVCVAPRTS